MVGYNSLLVLNIIRDIIAKYHVVNMLWGYDEAYSLLEPHMAFITFSFKLDANQYGNKFFDVSET